MSQKKVRPVTVQNDLSTAKDRKLTEYVLVGTLLSFGWALLIGLLYKQILPRLSE